MVVKAQNAKTFLGEKCISARIPLLLFRVEVLSAIDLDHETRRMADKIHDVWTNRRLATKTGALHAMSTKRRPYESLYVSGIGSKRPRSHALFR
jgi:hypothetical protein